MVWWSCIFYYVCDENGVFDCTNCIVKVEDARQMTLSVHNKMVVGSRTRESEKYGEVQVHTFILVRTLFEL